MPDGKENAAKHELADTYNSIQISLATPEFNGMGRYDPSPGREMEFGETVTSLPEARNFVLFAHLSLVSKTEPSLIRCSINVCLVDRGLNPKLGHQFDLIVRLCVLGLMLSQIRQTRWYLTYP